jgi:hypothetical protein
VVGAFFAFLFLAFHVLADVASHGLAAVDCHFNLVPLDGAWDQQLPAFNDDYGV